MEPRFRRRADGSLNLTDKVEAAKVKEANKGKPYTRTLSPEGVLDKAKKSLSQHHGDLANRKHLLGFFEIQFGVFRGQTFRWVAENALGYAAYLVASMKRDPTGGSKDSQEHAHNKGCFKEYIELFPSGRIAIAMKEEQYAESFGPGTSTALSHPTVSTEADIGPSATLTHPSMSTEIDDSTLLAEATKFEEAYVESGWKHTLPEVDQRWISKALFRWTAQGHPELVFSRVDKLWWYPPQVPLKTSNSPSLDNYFGHPLLLWMP
ncbi:hypothetical protein G5714_014937 [Onychostoma macrolepis]|uniref:DUF6729 domain-containing protein n=1 Tax=Onychostoma macrolepis TaxID=369639 RepID=A0A7J6C9S8_9TELE|nr:hypothetical protein G5714_014937 [Onychostoma macrolepis]